MNLANKKLSIDLSFYSALLIGLIMLVAAFGKIFYPSDLLVYFDRSVGILEILMISALVIFHEEWKSWALIVPVFALFAGYTLFWFIWGLPCGCLGKLIHLPNGATLVFDLIFLAVSLLLAKFLKAGVYLRFSLFAAAVAAPLGFAFAYWMYRYLSHFINNL